MYQPWCDSYSKPVVLYKLQLTEAGDVEKMNEWLPCYTSTDQGDSDIVGTHSVDVIQYISACTKTQIMYAALMSIIVGVGCSYSDRFIKDHQFLSMEELSKIAVDSDSERSLAWLLLETYKKITLVFRKELKLCRDAFELFWLFRRVFSSAHTLLKMYAGSNYSSVHTKSLLTVILKQKNFNSLRKHAFMT